VTVWLEATCGHELEWDRDEAPPSEWDCPDHGRVGLWAQRDHPSPEGLAPMPMTNQKDEDGGQ